jgi:hypothetical protein
MAHANMAGSSAGASFDINETGDVEIGILGDRITSFDVLLYEVGLKIGELHPDERARLDGIVRDLLEGVHECQEMISRLINPNCLREGARPEGSKPRIYVACSWGRNDDICTEIHLEGARGSDFEYDPRRQRKLHDQRPGYEAIHLRNVSCLSGSDRNDLDPVLKASVSEMVISAHRRMLIRLEDHFEVELVSEPVIVHDMGGGTRLDVVASPVLAQRQAARVAAAELETQRAILLAFKATFPEADPARFAETYRAGKRRGWTSKRIGEELAAIGAPANSEGTRSSGARPGTRRFEYTVSDLSGAVKLIEGALAATVAEAPVISLQQPSDAPRP